MFRKQTKMTTTLILRVSPVSGGEPKGPFFMQLEKASWTLLSNNCINNNAITIARLLQCLEVLPEEPAAGQRGSGWGDITHSYKILRG